ncbi:MAG: GH92 family glycosyl hydrolase [Flavobacteriales bacterium]
MKNSIFSFILIVAAAFFLTHCSSKIQVTDTAEEAYEPTGYDFVNPFIGTGGHGHTYPGATMPFGMVQLSPDTRLTGWDGCGGYHYTDSLIYGFSHTHLQGTGISDYGDILLAPTNSGIHTGKNWGERYRSAFKKDSEIAHPGYYSVYLDDHNMEVELTATKRVGIHKYHLTNEADSFTVFIDMAHRDPLIEYQLYPLNDSTIAGMRVSKEWAKEQRIYFVAEFSRPFIYQDQTYELTGNSVDPETGRATQEMELVPVFPLVFMEGSDLIVKVALSPVGVDGALQNMMEEAPHWNFSDYKEDARDVWESELESITIATQDTTILENFYTALYHSYTVPNTFTDVDGRYRGMDKKVHTATDHEQYTVFSLWDTFRATHPLYTITQREKTLDFIKSFLAMYDQGGDLPMWELAGNYTHCMIGYNAVPVIVDAYMKGITDFDTEKALEAMIKTSLEPEFGKEYFREKGYIAMGDEGESVSKNLEYAYNDWCIAVFAEALGKVDVAETYYRSAQNYKNTIDASIGYARAKRNGDWIAGFDPAEVNFNFTEANSYQYSFFVPQDVDGLMEHVGGKKKFNELLDKLFIAPMDLSGRHQPDITGLIGQYAHGNEPSHHMAYLYNYSGQPWKTQYRTQEILRDMYQSAPDGLSGNEDCGQMSSWYVLSALGLYSVTPGSDQYALTTPIIDSAMIDLGNGNPLIITTKMRDMELEPIDQKEQRRYIWSVTYNGEDWPNAYITHDMIMNGGSLEFDLAPIKNTKWGTDPANRPTSKINGYDITYAPTISAKRSFLDSTEVSITSESGARTEFRTTEEGTVSSWKLYSQPFMIYETTGVEARSQKQKASASGIVRGDFVKRKADWSIELISEYNNQYTAGGDIALIDGIRSKADFKSGDFQGYWGDDLEAIIDLGSKTAISSIQLSYLKDTRPWIFPPKSVTIETSRDKKSWTTYSENTIQVQANDEAVDHAFVGKEEFVLARYVRVKAVNYGPMPEWHISAGQTPWIFVDEIIID